jgi:hypothetical protein
MRTKFQMIALALGIAFSLQVHAQTGDTIFPKGELSTTKNQHGKCLAWRVKCRRQHVRLRACPSNFRCGCKAGLAQSSRRPNIAGSGGHWLLPGKGKTNTDRSQGDVVKCAPGVEHWHGASPTSGFTYLATTPIQKGKTVWLEPVSDKDYNSAK